MRFSQPLVRNNVMKKIPNYTLLLLTVAVFAIGLACQKAQLAEYKKLGNDGEVPRINLEDAKKDFDAGAVVIVDSRAAEAYRQEHITGAINIPIGSTDDKFDAIPKGKKIIVYCS